MFYESDLHELPPKTTSYGLLRSWQDVDNALIIKSSSHDQVRDLYHVEAINECIAYELGDLLGIPVQPTKLDQLTLSSGGVIDVSVTPIINAQYKKYTIETVHKLLSKHNFDFRLWKERYPRLVMLYPQLREDFDKLIVFDYLIDNRERDLKNFSIMFRTVTRKGEKVRETRLSPLGNNGFSLLQSWTSLESLSHFLKNKELREQVLVGADSLAKTFARFQSIQINMVDPSILASLNLEKVSKGYPEVLEKYRNYLGDLRHQVVSELVSHRIESLHAMRWLHSL